MIPTVYIHKKKIFFKNHFCFFSNTSLKKWMHQIYIYIYIWYIHFFCEYKHIHIYICIYIHYMRLCVCVCVCMCVCVCVFCVCVCVCVCLKVQNQKFSKVLVMLHDLFQVVRLASISLEIFLWSHDHKMISNLRKGIIFWNLATSTNIYQTNIFNWKPDIQSFTFWT